VKNVRPSGVEYAFYELHKKNFLMFGNERERKICNLKCKKYIIAK
jgi:predicted DNA-binding protein (MmcQ/YjbR family)